MRIKSIAYVLIASQMMLIASTMLQGIASEHSQSVSGDSQKSATKERNDSGGVTPKHRKTRGNYVKMIFVVDNIYACQNGDLYLNASPNHRKCLAAYISKSMQQKLWLDCKTLKKKTIAVSGFLDSSNGKLTIHPQLPEHIQLLKQRLNDSSIEKSSPQ